jgi:hypothetical protein
LALASTGSIVRRCLRPVWCLLTVCVLCLPVDAGAQAGGTLIISEFRLRGPNGPNDEFIEIYNNSGADHTVASISGTGYGLAASDGVTRCVIPNGTIIPDKGHYLCVNSVGYSLASYAAGSGTTATADATYTTDIPDNVGLALFNNSIGGGSYVLAHRLDAVGSASEANTLYKEGTGYPATQPFNNASFGTFDLRSRFTNNTGAPITRLRFRVVDITTFPSISGVVDLRPRTASDLVVNVDQPPCGAGPSDANVRGTTLEQPPRRHVVRPAVRLRLHNLTRDPLGVERRSADAGRLRRRQRHRSCGVSPIIGPLAHPVVQ